jgi:hypothetical protein
MMGKVLKFDPGARRRKKYRENWADPEYTRAVALDLADMAASYVAQGNYAAACIELLLTIDVLRRHFQTRGAKDHFLPRLLTADPVLFATDVTNPIDPQPLEAYVEDAFELLRGECPVNAMFAIHRWAHRLSDLDANVPLCRFCVREDREKCA